MKIVAAIATVAAIIAGLFFYIIQPGPSGVVASLRLPDGSEYMVTQRCNWSPEPYTITFYMHPAGGPWSSCYMDHQSDRWSNAAMTYDPVKDIVTVTRQGRWQAALDRKNNTFSRGDGVPKVQGSASGTIQDPEFPFPR